VTLPIAHVVHHSARRLRLRVPARRGQRAFFEHVPPGFEDEARVQAVRANATSASLLFVGDGTDLGTIGRAGEAAGWFRLAALPPATLPAAQRVAAPIGALDRRLRDLSGGSLDLANGFFLGLLFFGVYELAIGNFRRPPWYTVFWYAFGVFSKTLVDKAAGDTTAS